MSTIPAGMLQQTFDYLLEFTIQHEGDTPFMYNNWPIKNANKDVTVGVGLAIANENVAASEEIRRMFIVKATGQPASPAEMRAEFRRVNDLPRTGANLLTDYPAKWPPRMDRTAILDALREKMLVFWNSKGQSFPDFAA